MRMYHSIDDDSDLGETILIDVVSLDLSSPSFHLYAAFAFNDQ